MKKVLLIGDPVAHSLSPRLHNKWIRDYGLDAKYEATVVTAAEIPDLVGSLRQGKIHAVNATLPHKEALLQLADAASPVAAALGAANTLYMKDGKLFADNSDPEGFLENLKTAVPGWGPKGTALILGTGAAARAAIYALGQAGQTLIAVSGRDFAKAKKAAKAFSGLNITALPWDQREAPSPGLVINATPMGLPGFDALDYDLTKLDKETIVYDLVYGREKTPFTNQAKKLGLRTVDGLGMLIFQAIPLFEAWFGVRPQMGENLLDWLRKGV